MKIINRDKFLELPSGIVFSKYTPQVFGSIRIKGDTINNDFYVQRLSDSIDCESSNMFFDILDKAEDSEGSFDIDLNSEIRDGMFDEDQLFAVWEDIDLKQLIDRLKRAKGM